MAKKVKKAVKKQNVTKIVKKVEKKSPKAAPKKVAETKTKPAKKVVSKVAKKQAAKSKVVAKPKPQKKTVKKAKAKPEPKVKAKENSSSTSPEPEKLVKPQVPAQEKVPLKYDGYTLEEYKEYMNHVKELQTYSNKQLQEELQKNSQSKSGNKDELIAKVADGRVKGSIPRCPSCFGGRPKFDQQKGYYSCPGYRDDTEFVNCHKKFDDDDIKRTPWNK